MNLLSRTTVLIVFSSCAAPSQILSVCEVLRGLEDLNQKEVRVRGTWSIGDLGEALIPVDPCDHSTVRDGWVWKDVVQVLPITKEAKAFGLDYYHLLEKIPRAKPAKIVATLSGHLETRDHFDVSGGRPIAFGYFVAILRYRNVEDLEIVSYGPGEIERELKWRKKPGPIRLR